ncbi:MAG: acyl-homoserine-lactone synthase [Bacteroidota bacterium]
MNAITQFHLVKHDNIREDLLDEMFRLRYQKNVVEGKWSEGITVKDGKEMDDYDHENAFYVIGTNCNNEVLVSLRLISTKYQYLTKEKFPELFEFLPLPNTDKIWEVTRLTTKYPSDDYFSLTYVAALKFGIQNSIDNYLVFNDKTHKEIYRKSGLCLSSLGDTKLIDNKFEVYIGMMPVMPEFLEVLIKKNRLNVKEIIFNF